MSRPHLNRRLTLEAGIRGGDGAGGFVPVWQALGTVWASLDQGSLREAMAGDVALPLQPVTVTVRAAPLGAAERPEIGHRFREGTRAYVIRAVHERDRRGMYLTCLCQEERLS